MILLYNSLLLHLQYLKTSNDAYNILTEVVDAPNTFEYYSKQEKRTLRRQWA